MRIVLGFTLRRGLRGWLRTGAAMDLLKHLACAGERVSLGVDQALDLQNQLDIAAAIKPLAGSALVGLELRKLRLPEAQDVGFELADAGHIANFEVETVGDCWRMIVTLVGELRGHGVMRRRPQRKWRPRSKRSIGHNLHSL